MAIRDIVFHLHGGDGYEDHVASALMLARKHEARLLGVVGITRPQLPNYASNLIPVDLIESRWNEVQADVKERCERFTIAAERAGVEARSAVEETSASDALSHHARVSDLVLVGQPPKAGGTMLEEAPVAEVAVDAGRPVMMLPRGGSELAVGGHAVVAWNDSPPAARALGDAMPLLGTATRVSVVTVHASGDGGDAPSLGPVCAHLAAHGIEAEPHVVDSADDQAGAALLAFATARDAGFLVMGAYGKSRIREWVLGGATEHVIMNAPLPVLFAD